MNLPLKLFLLAILFSSCQHKIEEVIESQKVGNDVDVNGCKGSAGYVWSVILQKCIRAFEEGIEFHNKDFTMNTFVVLSTDKSEAEAFLPSETTIQECIMLRSDDKLLYENKKGTMSIQFTEKEYILDFRGEKYFAARTEHLDLLLKK
ncbi:MAG: hypothetical protein ACK50Y_07655 [Flavobacteriia bacterium]